VDRRIARLLVVDDSASMRRVLRQVLAGLGFSQVDEAGDGVQALERLEASSYDLLITDWYMPYMTGLELLRAVRARPALELLPVLLVTGHVSRDHAFEAEQAGATGFLQKPVIGHVLEETVSQLLDPTQPASGLARHLQLH